MTSTNRIKRSVFKLDRKDHIDSDALGFLEDERKYFERKNRCIVLPSDWAKVQRLDLIFHRARVEGYGRHVVEDGHHGYVVHYSDVEEEDLRTLRENNPQSKILGISGGGRNVYSRYVNFYAEPGSFGRFNKVVFDFLLSLANMK